MSKYISKKYLNNIAIYSLIAIFFMADRYLKYLAINNVFEPPKQIISNLFTLSFTANYNISFSLPLGGWWLNIIVISIVFLLTVMIVYLVAKGEHSRISVILLTIILFGAISNLTDRLTLGYVVDYLDLRYFTIFNLADVMISTGSIIFIISSIHSNKKV